MAYSHYTVFTGTRPGQVEGTEQAQQETMAPVSFSYLRIFLYNILGPIVPTFVPCTCPGSIPVQCK